MQRTVKINFPDGFEFPKEYNFGCAACVFWCSDMDSEGYGYCVASDDYTCPFYGNDDVVEI